MLFRPAPEMRGFTGPFRITKIARDKLLAHGQPSVGGKNHVGQFRLRRYQLDFAVERRQSLAQTFPLCFGELTFSSACSAHPGIDLVLDTVVVRPAKQQFAHLTSEVSLLRLLRAGA